MKTEQEQIEKIQEIIGDSFEYDFISAELDSGEVYINIEEAAKAIVAAGYGDVSEYKAEIEDLKEEIIYLERKIAIRDNALKDRDKAIEMLEGKQDTIVKQAKIDVLNELKKRARTSYVLDDFILGSVVFSKDIDELIREVEEQ